MSWKDYITVDEVTYKLLYKGIDIGLSREFLFDLRFNTATEPSDEMIESLYNSNPIVRRDKRIDDILSNHIEEVECVNLTRDNP